MSWLFALLMVVTGMVIYLLAAPVYIEINSITGLCELRFHHAASARLKLANSSLILDLKIGWWRKQIDLFAKRRSKQKKESKKVKRKNWNISFRKIRNVAASFKVNQCNISIDTGSPPTNGILFPLFFGLSRITRKKIQINFFNENEIILEIKNNMASILWTFIFS